LVAVVAAAVEDSVAAVEDSAALAAEALVVVAQAGLGKIILQFNNRWQGIL
jgi:protein-L-isoaspartate O-methyltransferase